MINENEQFAPIGGRYLKALFDFWPNLGSFAGLHEYDSRQPDPGADRIQSRLRDLDEFSSDLARIDPAALDAEEGFDYRLLRTAVESEKFQWQREQEHRRNPMWYLQALEITNFLVRSYAPLEERLRAAIGYLLNTPRVLVTARANLLPSLPRPFVETSLEAYRGMLSFYAEDLPRWASPLTDGALRAELDAARRAAQGAVEAFVQDLEGRYLPASNDDFAIGADNYRLMLQGELVDLPLETVLAIGERDLARNLQGAREKARQVDPNATVEQVFAMLRSEHPAAAELIPMTSSLLEELRQFLLDKDVVSVPSDVRAQVAETPAFMRWTFASMDNPGPFEKVATEAYYYITPPDPAWSAEQQEEWLSAFNRYLLRDVSIHEAYPGHYVQYLHLHYRVELPLRQVLLSYAFVEGWAHYVEEMMLDAGYGDDSPRLRLAQLEEALLRDCRYICSIRMHTQGMSLDEATRFFIENAFMEELPARKEAVRGTFDPGYLYYTLGKLMILKLREDWKARTGKDFNLKQFHDRLLSYGGPPVPLARAAMLEQKAGSVL